MGVMFTFDEQIISPDDVRVRDRRAKTWGSIMNHRLAKIIHYACFSYDDHWLRELSANGEYYSTKGRKAYTIWDDWDELDLTRGE